MTSEKNTKKILIIRIRGKVGVNQKVEKTMRLIGLKNKFNAVLLDENEKTKGILKRIKDYVSFGIADEKTINAFKDKKVLRLKPPKGGFKRETRLSGEKGELGNKKEKINDLFKRMI